MNRFSPENKDRMDHAEQLLAAARQAAESASYDEAFMFQEEAYFIKASLLGRDHPETAAVAEEIAQNTLQFNLEEKVGVFLRRRLEALTDPHDPRVLQLAGLAERIGNACNSGDRLAEAGVFYGLALAAYEYAGAAGDRPALFLMQKMVGVHYHLGNLPVAQELAERVIALDEQLFGADHPKIAADLSSLGSILYAQNRLEDARSVYERAVAIEDRQLNWDNPRLAADLTNLGNLLIEMGDLSAAKERLERALLIDEKGFGHKHPKIAADLTELASLLRKMGDLPAARQVLEHLIVVDAAAFGEESARLAADLSRLGMLYREMGSLEKAREAFTRALAIGEKALGPAHLKLAPDLEALSRTQQELGQTAAARENLTRALLIYETYLSGDQPEVRSARERLQQLTAE